jgi:sugar lactone lactonase YvrE
MLRNPTGVVLDNHHNLYIASGANHVVQMVSADGMMTTVAGTGNSGSSGDGGPANHALLRNPVSLAVDPSGNLYIADPEDNKIRRVAADGTISTFAGTGSQGFSGDGEPAAAADLSSPSAVAVDPYGALVIADTGNNRIRRVTSDGVIDTIAGTGKANFSGDGGPAYLAALNAPDSLAVGADGTIYAADEGNQRIRRIFADGGIDSLMSGSLTPILFQSPIRLAVDADQQLFISDSSDARVQLMGSACQLNPAAGTGIPGFAGDGGLATRAQVNVPSSLAPDASGDVFFADSDNNRIRRLYQGGCGSPANIFFNPAPAMTGMTVNGLVRLSCPTTEDTALALSANGLAVPGTVTLASGQTDANFSFQVPDVATTTGFAVTASTPRYSVTDTLFAQPAGTQNAGALSMTLTPSSQVGGGPVTGVVTLTSPAPAGGTPVSLASNNSAATVAGNASIPAGQLGAEFAVGTSPVTQPAIATITGNSGGVSTSTPLSILTGGLSALSGLSIAPSSVASGQTATGTVTLASAAPANGVQVNLTSSNPAATVPASITIPVGQTTGTFPVSTSTVSSPTAATITASSANTVPAIVTVNPSQSGASGTIASFSVSPSSMTSGQTATGTVTLASAAPASGVQVGLTSSNPAATVPASITIPAGQTTGAFPVSTSAVSSPTTATITASSANAVPATVTVTPFTGSQSGVPGTIASFSVSPQSVTGGQTATGTVTLASAAPASGVQVGLASSNPAAAVPASITIPAGQTTGTFPVSTSTVSSPATAMITASSANMASAMLMVNPATTGQSGASGTIASLSVSPSSVTSGQSATGTVTLASAAPAGGVQVGLASSNPAATVPASITIPAGQTTGTFGVSTSTVSSPTAATITASSANTASATLTVNPAAQACVGSISLSRSEVIGGNSVSGTVALTGPAAKGGQPVNLSSTSSSASVPAQVTVPAGQNSTGFMVTTTPVLSAVTPVISANTGACVGSSAGLMVLPSL